LNNSAVPADFGRAVPVPQYAENVARQDAGIALMMKAYVTIVLWKKV
jgi:isoprenylcysteine carboxyl methyltransferase (ICMT) family protein YpbQ